MLHSTTTIYFVQDQGGAIWPANLWRRDHGPVHHFTLKEAQQHTDDCREHISDWKLPYADKKVFIRQETICSTMIEARPFQPLGKWVLVTYEILSAIQFRNFVDGTPGGTATRKKALLFDTKEQAYQYKESPKGREPGIYHHTPVLM